MICVDIYIFINTPFLHIGTYLQTDISICIQHVLPYMFVDFSMCLPICIYELLFETIWKNICI